MNKAYNKITWQNKPSTATPLNQTNLNEMSNALDTIDDRVIALDSGKVSSVTVTNTLPTGDTIATITVDGTATNIKSAQVVVDDTPSATSENPLQNKAIYEMLNNLLPEETVQGNPIAISDASGLNAKACSVDLLPIQDLHGYDSPWVGGSGKNKLPEEFTDGYYWGSSGEQVSNEYCKISDYAKVSPNTTYIYSGTNLHKGSESQDVYVQVCFYDTNKTFIERNKNIQSGNVTFTTTSETEYVRVSAGVLASNLQIELGSTATSYSPYSNICPISGRTEASVVRTGKNLFDKTAKDTSKGYAENRYLTANGGQMQPGGDSWYVSEYMECEANTHYTLTGLSTTDSNTPCLCLYDSSKTLISSVQYINTATKAFTTPSNATYIRMSVGPNATQEDNITLLETEKIQTHTHQYGQTVYGGVDDFVNGKVTGTIGSIVLNGSETWDNFSAQNGFYMNLTAMKSGRNTESLSEWLPTISSVTDFGLQFGAGNSVLYACHIIDNMPEITDLASWKSYLSAHNLRIAFPLSTPTELTLTPEEISLLKGNNVISTDGDNIILKYSADIKAWVENQLSNS